MEGNGSGSNARRRVLVVDDDRGIRQLCIAALEDAGFDVLEARDGREGLARAVSDSPDLALLDVRMPILDGFELAVALRHIRETSDLPIVFLTSESEPAVERHAYEVGALGFFTKPFDPRALSAYIGALLPDPRAVLV